MLMLVSYCCCLLVSLLLVPPIQAAPSITPHSLAPLCPLAPLPLLLLFLRCLVPIKLAARSDQALPFHVVPHQHLSRVLAHTRALLDYRDLASVLRLQCFHVRELAPAAQPCTTELTHACNS